MTYRELKTDEFHRLAAIEWLAPEHRPVPGQTRVMVAEQDGEIQAFACVSLVPHIEPIWVADKHRFGTVFKRVFEQAKTMLNGHGGFYVHATNDQHGGYLKRLGLELKRGWMTYEGRK